MKLSLFAAAAVGAFALVACTPAETAPVEPAAVEDDAVMDSDDE